MQLTAVQIVPVPIPPSAVGTPFDVLIPYDSVIVYAERDGRQLNLHVAQGMASQTTWTLFLLSVGTPNHDPNNPCEFVALVHDRGGRTMGYLFKSVGMSAGAPFMGPGVA
jgi:hypothetical protein